MNKLVEIQELIKKFIYEKQQTQKEITTIEEKRNVLARERNNLINENNGEIYSEEVQVRIFALGNQIKELGNQSQEIQNKLDRKYLDIKDEVTCKINENISKIMTVIHERKEKILGIQERIKEKENRDARYTKQKEEFYKRFGRIPVLSENAMKENEMQEEEYRKNRLLVEQLDNEIKVQEEEESKLIRIANDLKKGKWEKYIENNKEQANVANLYKQEIRDSYAQKIAEEVINPIVESIVEQNMVIENKKEIEEESIILPFAEEKKGNTLKETDLGNTQIFEKLNLDELQPLEEISVEEIKPLEEINIEEIGPIDEVNIGEINLSDEITGEKINPLEEIDVEEIMPLVKLEKELETDCEDFSKQETEVQQEKTLEELLNEKEEHIENKIIGDIITSESEQEDNQKIENYFGEKVKLLNINVKFEDGEVVYKAQVNNGDCIKLYPRKVQAGNILLKDKENREELKQILINYAIAEYRMLDKKVIKKIDPSICEVLVRFSKKYNYNVQSLIYNYAMSFSKSYESDMENIPNIIYNFAYLKETNLDKKEKKIIAQIYKNARKNNKIDIIGDNVGIKKVKYILKRILTINDTNALPEGKY